MGVDLPDHDAKGVAVDNWCDLGALVEQLWAQVAHSAWRECEREEVERGRYRNGVARRREGESYRRGWVEMGTSKRKERRVQLGPACANTRHGAGAFPTLSACNHVGVERGG